MKKSKNWHFYKGVTPWFWSKKGHFPNFFFLGNIGEENIFYDILKRKNGFLGYKNKKLEKSKNSNVSKGLTHGFGPKMVNFPTFFLRNIGEEDIFHNILERKNAFLGYKNKNFKKSKDWHFSKGVKPWFLSKNGHFSNFSFWAI